MISEYYTEKFRSTSIGTFLDVYQKIKSSFQLLDNLVYQQRVDFLYNLSQKEININILPARRNHFFFFRFHVIFHKLT